MQVLNYEQACNKLQFKEHAIGSLYENYNRKHNSNAILEVCEI